MNARPCVQIRSTQCLTHMLMMSIGASRTESRSRKVSERCQMDVEDPVIRALSCGGLRSAERPRRDGRCAGFQVNMPHVRLHRTFGRRGASAGRSADGPSVRSFPSPGDVRPRSPPYKQAPPLFI
ncbi:hypothetical protein M8818_002426 [Zalaria obscura]|uniref:Uncharacterized protein n=1 Tax=Zalaria obscura TaxID=2024903 RepID=A0ACC3SIC8_9PEZI